MTREPAVRGVAHLRRVLEAANGLAMAEPRSEEELAQGLEAVYRELFEVDFSGYDLGELKREAPELLEEMRAVKLALRARIPFWAERGLMGRRTQPALRGVFRIIRYGRDIIGEIRHGHPRLGRREKTEMGFAGPEGFLEVSPQFAAEPFALKPGDVVLQRGMVHNSAAIARIGDVDSQFSHVAIVARNARGELVMVEAVIEDGAIVSPIEAALRHGLGRAVLFRHRDGELAERAAELIHEHVLARDGRRRPRVLYDFSMALGDYRLMFCAELVRLAYAMASTAEVVLPSYPTRLDMQNRDFIQRIGVSAIETFAPGDLELEPAFDIVAEWRDYRVTSELRLKDMIMTKLFEWMEKEGLKFRPTLWIRTIARLGRISSHLPHWLQEITRRWIGKVPPNMTAEAIAAVAMLHKTAERFYKHLRQREDAAIQRAGRPLHPREVLDDIEQQKAVLEAAGRPLGYLRRPSA